MKKFDVRSFYIIDSIIDLIQSETAYGMMTVAQVGVTYHQLGNKPPTLPLAILLWEVINNRTLTPKEVDLVLSRNR